MQRNQLQQMLTLHALPDDYADFVSLYLAPVAAAIDGRIRRNGIPLIGINGSQGSGKSTAALFLKLLLESDYGHRVVVLSIDDFYHGKATREAMAQSLHPLFATRGVPGTHDIELAINTIAALRKAAAGECVEVPRFDKANDDRKPREQWDRVQGPVSAIILEGWCLGAPPLSDALLHEPVNELERVEDRDGTWRMAYSNFLAEEYQQLFDDIDWLLMLKAPSFSVVYDWRLLQEQKLAQSTAHGGSLLNAQQVGRFIAHYQRLTEHCLHRIPDVADAVIELDDRHRMTTLRMQRT